MRFDSKAQRSQRRVQFIVVHEDVVAGRVAQSTRHEICGFFFGARSRAGDAVVRRPAGVSPEIGRISNYANRRAGGTAGKIAYGSLPATYALRLTEMSLQCISFQPFGPSL